MRKILKKYFISFTPQSVLLLKGYNGGKFVKDLLSGLIVGIIALPLSIALAIASGAPPEIGLVTAAVAGFSAALFAGSKYQVTGPTNSFVITLGIIGTYSYQGMLAATFLGGVILIVMGILRLGKVVNYIAKPIVVGFTVGIALVIFSTQIVDFFSLKITSAPSTFFAKWVVYFKAINTINYVSFSIGLASLIFMLIWIKFKIKIPGALIAVIITSFVVFIFKLNVPTIGTKFGNIKMNMNFSFPFTEINLLSLFKPAVTIAMLVSIESLLSAMAGDNMTKTKTNSNAELVSQGVANIMVSCFGGIPSSGALARTSANIKNGGVTPFSSMIHAVFLLIVGLVLMPLVKFIPLTTLAAVLFMVCKNMIDIKALKRLFKSTVFDMILFLTTFALTVLFNLVIATVTGVALSFVLFFARMFIKKINFKSNCLTIKINENKIILSGMLNFINDNYLVERVNKVENAEALKNYKTVIIETTELHTFDMSGSEAIHSLKNHYEHQNIEVFIIYKQKKPNNIIINNQEKQPEQKDIA